MEPFKSVRLYLFNSFNLLKKRLHSPLLRAVVLTLFSVILTFILNLFPVFQKLELLSIDVRYILRPDIKKSDSIVLVNFDDASLKLYGQWPWSRFYQTLLVDTLSQYKVSAIGYDVFFSEPERPIIKPTADNNSFILRNNDDEFQRAISESGLVYLAYASRDPHKGLSKGEVMRQVEILKSQFSEDKNNSLTFMKSRLNKATKELDPFIFKSIDIDPPIYKLLQHAKGFGFAQPGYSKDSTMRNFILFRYYDGLLLNPITLVMFADWGNFDLKNVEIKPNQSVILKGVRLPDEPTNKDITIPVDNNLQALLNWPGTFDSSFTHISFKDIVYLHAFNRALKIINNTRKDSITENTIAIKKALSLDYLLPEEEIEQLAKKIAMARFISDRLKKGVNEQEIIKGLQDNYPFNELQVLIDDAKTIRELEAFFTKNDDGTWQDFMREFSISEKNHDRVRGLFTGYQRHVQDNPKVHIYPYIMTPHIPAKVNGKDVMLSPWSLKDKLVLVGLTGKNTIDLNPTPYEKDCPMVFYHASGLNMMLTGQFLKYPPMGLSEAMIVVCSLCVALIGVYRSVSLLSAFTIFLTITFSLISYKLWTHMGQWIEFIPVVTAITITYITSLVVQFVKVYSEKSKIRGIFASMVSPAVLTVMENNPDKFALTGERRFATTYFSKIDAIDSISSSFSAEQLPLFLSTYLTPMSDVIIEYNGYIDKYEGAVIMADFGIPLEDRENPVKCAFTTLEQRFFIDSFRFAINKRYDITPTVSIGINSGYVSAGNMGSDRKFQYTVMGDPVNMAARLMAANAIYTSNYAITSLETINFIKDYVYARPLDKILLKGKTIPTMIYDIIGWRKEAYREILKDKSLPSFIHSFWTYAPVESIFYFKDFWARQYERLDSILAKEISDFFTSCEVIAKEIISLEIQLEAINISEQIHKNLHINTMPETIEAIAGYLDELTPETFNNDKSRSLKNRATLLFSRYKNAKTMGIDDNFTIKDSKALSSLLDTKYDIYQRACKKFIGSIGASDYINLISLVGEPENKELVETFESGLHAYWRRDWHEALEIFKKALLTNPYDNPLKEMIQRIEYYMTNPPGVDWQGEYIQTKK